MFQKERNFELSGANQMVELGRQLLNHTDSLRHV